MNHKGTVCKIRSINRQRNASPHEQYHDNVLTGFQPWVLKKKLSKQ